VASYGEGQWREIRAEAHEIEPLVYPCSREMREALA
jgi:hypothetical protein